MATSLNTQVDVSILKHQMGIEVVDDGNGYLNAGDVLINRTIAEVETHIVTSAELKSSATASALLNQYAGGRTVVSFIFDPQKSKSFIASASLNHESYLRMYEVMASDDSEIISEGSGVRYPVPRSREGLGISGLGLGAMVPRYGSDFGNSKGGGLGSLEFNSATHDLATTSCDSKPNDVEKLACYKEKDAADARAEKFAELQAQAETAKEGIRAAILNNTLTPAVIAEFVKLQAQIESL